MDWITRVELAERVKYSNDQNGLVGNMYFQIRKTIKSTRIFWSSDNIWYIQHLPSSIFHLHLHSAISTVATAMSISPVSMVIFFIFPAPWMHAPWDLTSLKYIFVLMEFASLCFSHLLSSISQFFDQLLDEDALSTRFFL